MERALGAGFDELAHTPWTHRLSDDVVATAAARLRIVSTLDICSYGRDTPAIRTALDNLRRFHDGRRRRDLRHGPGQRRRSRRASTRASCVLLAEAGLEYEEVLEALVRAPIEPGAPADLLVARRATRSTTSRAFDGSAP